jgi:hypothetical protein
MNTRLWTNGTGTYRQIVAAALATLITAVLFGTVVASLQSDGLPLERAAAAQRACATYRFVSERESCVDRYAASQHPEALASND